MKFKEFVESTQYPTQDSGKKFLNFIQKKFKSFAPEKYKIPGNKYNEYEEFKPTLDPADQKTFYEDLKSEGWVDPGGFMNVFGPALRLKKGKIEVIFAADFTRWDYVRITGPKARFVQAKGRSYYD